MKNNLTLSALVAFVCCLCVACSVNSNSSQKDDEISESMESSEYFKFENGMLVRPVDYRTWVHVGTPTTPNELNDGKAPFPEMHNVYIDPVSYTYWKETGSMRDGTILVKELVSVGSKAAVSGNGYFMGDFIGLEATVKSSKHFPEEPGNWSYFSFTSPDDGILKAEAKAFATKDCNACHQASAAIDFVFTQYYPVLTAAQGVGGDIAPENSTMRAQSTASQEMNIWAPTADTPNDTDLGIPLDKVELFEYLKAGEYKTFKHQETNSHPSLGPHTKLGLPVRVFMNDIIANSLKDGNDEHPKGSIIVKEMFGKDKSLQGWAVMVKTHDIADENGKGWFWYEVTSSSDMNALAAMGNGVVGCFACHNIGSDMVRTAFPLL